MHIELRRYLYLFFPFSKKFAHLFSFKYSKSMITFHDPLLWHIIINALGVTGCLIKTHLRIFFINNKTFSICSKCFDQGLFNFAHSVKEPKIMIAFKSNNLEK